MNIEETIRRAAHRELAKMQEENGWISDKWTGEALALWIAPGIIRSVKRALNRKPKRGGKR